MRRFCEIPGSVWYNIHVVGDYLQSQEKEIEMRIGDRVTHIDYPGQPGVIVAMTNRWGSQPRIILVRWANKGTCSRHIPSALRVI